jgi:iron complex outermembrane receptor protein
VNPQEEYAFQDYQFVNTEWAGYGQVTYKITDDIKLTGNLRYTWDEKNGQEEERLLFFGAVSPALDALYGAAVPTLDITKAEVCLSGNPANCAAGPLAKGVKSIGTFAANGNAVRQLDGTSSAVTGGAGIEWTPTPDIFTYARYSRGYAPLSFNAGFVSANPEVAPESLNAYEVGYKQSFGNKLAIQTAIYYYDYENIQTPISVSVGGVLEGQFINIPKAESEGVELEGVWTPVHDLIFTLSYSYDYTAFLTGCSGTITGGVLTPAPGTACVVNTEDPLGTGPGAKVVPGQVGANLDQSIKGSPIPEAPRNKIAVSGAYTFHFDPGNLTVSATYSWRDTQGGSLFNTPYNTSPSWYDVDLRAIWSGNHDRYEIIGFIKNLTNTVQYQSGPASVGLLGNATTATTNALGRDYVESYGLNPPRTFGVEVRYKFF